MKGHLKREEIQHFIEKRVVGDALVEIDEHLASCEICGSELDEILDGQSLPETSSLLDLDSPETDEHPEYELLAEYVNGNADDVTREIVDVHLDACESCSTQIDELRILRAQITSDATKNEPAPGWGDWLRILIPAAALVVLGFFAWLIFIPRESNIETAGVTVPIEELPTPSDLGGPANTDVSNVDQPVLADPLNDGGRVIGLDENGELVGLDITRDLNDKLIRILKGGNVEVPAAAKGLATQRGVLMGEGDGVAFSLKSPVGKVIESDRPTFRWEPFKNAESYEVNVFDENFNKVASSGKITSPSWVATTLPRGKIYQWQVTATKDGVETRSPVRPAPDARFLVITSDAAAGIWKARSVQPRSNLLLGIAYAEAGMIEEARGEIDALAKKNPNSATARRLLRAVR